VFVPVDGCFSSLSTSNPSGSGGGGGGREIFYSFDLLNYIGLNCPNLVISSHKRAYDFSFS